MSRLQVMVHGFGEGENTVFPLKQDATRIGRDAGNEIVLPSPFVSRLHASLIRKDGGLWVRAEGLNPTLVNNRELARSESVEVRPGDTLLVQGFALTIQRADEVLAPTDTEVRARFAGFVTRLHESVINRLDPRVHRLESIRSDEGRDAALGVLQTEMENLAPELDAEVIAYATREALRTTLLLSLLGQAGEANVVSGFGDDEWHVTQEQARFWLTGRISATLGLRTTDASQAKDGLRKLREGFDEAYATWRGHITPDLGRHLALWLLQKDVCDLIFGLGPLTDLVRMPDVTEIMMVSKDQIYIEQNGVLEETGRTFVSDRVGEQILERILGPVNRRVDRSSPMVDARLPDGSRVNAVIPPLAVKGPCITIRRFSRDPLTIDDLVGFGALSAQVATFLRACVKGRKNLVISGGTGSGKTTLLNALSGWIPSGERIVTIEDTAELRLQQRHVVTLEARPANVENRGEVTIRDLVRNALRMRPDRIIVGECRGKEALDMLQAMNTGHEGSMTTGHANAPIDMLQRLEVMVLEAADLPLAAVRRQIVSGIDVVIQQSRLRNGKRCVVSVTEIVGLDDLTKDVIADDIFVRREGAGLAFTGYLPTFADDLITAGHLDPAEVFWSA
ncbi:MAG: ATPase, T2SS/T4P/T4SS family [Vicinamibacterales bacterium]